MPGLYGDNGFRAVARTPFVDQFKPAGWNYDTFKKFNAGRPDVVFMVYDPAHAAPYRAGEGKTVPEYDDGTAAQHEELNRLKRAKAWAAVRAKAEQTLARLSARQKWDESQHPREPAGSSTGGQFASGGGEGGAAGAGEKPKPPQGELFPEIPPLKPKGNSKIDDFAKDNVRLDSSTRTDEEKGKKFLQRWNDTVRDAPAELRKEFLGGIPATMGISYNDREDSIELSGKLMDDDGATIGEYTRTIDFNDKKAESNYFKLYGGETGQGLGKKMLAANVAMYQKMGIEKVEVHADIDVGGYAWAKYGYVPTLQSWRGLRSDLESSLDEKTGGGYTPESWDEISSDDQDRIFNAWADQSRDEFYDSEITSWRENGGDLAEAKRQLADKFDGDVDKGAKWLYDDLRGYSMIPEGENVAATTIGAYLSSKDISREDVVVNTAIEFKDRRGDGNEDPDVTVDWDKVQNGDKLGTDEKSQVEEAVAELFNKAAEKDRDEIEPPDYIGDNISEYQSEVWDSMRDRDKFAWARDNGELPEATESSGTEIDDESASELRDMLDHGSDPEVIWAIADHPAGKDLLLGSDWAGVLNLKDHDTMERFNAYVGKAKAEAT